MKRISENSAFEGDEISKIDKIGKSVLYNN
jgi:hypothetical protein